MSDKKNIINFPNEKEEKSEKVIIFPVQSSKQEENSSKKLPNNKNKKDPAIFRFVNYISTFFDGVPAAVKTSMLRSLLFVALLDAMCVVMILWTGFNWFSVLFPIGFSVFTILAVVSMRRRIKNNSYVTFVGVVTECKKIGFGKKLSYYIIKIVNSDGKILNFRYQENPKGLDRGLPVTLYIADTEPIIKTENGPYIERYISIQYSADTISDAENVDEELSVSEYLKK